MIATESLPAGVMTDCIDGVCDAFATAVPPAGALRQGLVETARARGPPSAPTRRRSRLRLPDGTRVPSSHRGILSRSSMRSADSRRVHDTAVGPRNRSSAWSRVASVYGDSDLWGRTAPGRARAAGAEADEPAEVARLESAMVRPRGEVH